MLHDFRQAMIITRREVRDQFRDWRIVVPIIILTLFFPALMNFTADRIMSFVESYDVPLVGDRMIPLLLMVVGFFPISISLVIALESFVGEKERRSIEPLLSSPMTDFQLYLGKLMAVLIPPLSASFLGMTVYLIGVYRELGWFAPPPLLLVVIALTIMQGLLMVSGAVVISTQATSSRAANLLSSFIVVPMALLIIGESFLMFWADYPVLWWAVFGEFLITSLLIRMGMAYFSREELLGRELDVLNLRWSWIVFARRFRGGADSVWGWVKQVYRDTFPIVRVPALIIILLLVIGGFIGAQQAKIFELPPEILDFSKLGQGLVEGVEELETIRFFSVSSVGTIWLHNLRAILIATFVGLFTFGVFGAMILMLPFTLIGYVAALVSGAGISPWLFLTALVLPHGIFEIPAIAIAGGAILRIGATLMSPAEGRTISEALLESLADWARVVLAIAVPLFLIAAFFEIFVTPQVAIYLLGQ